MMCDHYRYSNADLYDIPDIKYGLKDHHIQQLVSKLAVNLKSDFQIKHQCLREVISNLVMEYLEDNNLRIDKK